MTGTLVTYFGTFARAASSIAVIYLLGIIAVSFARETKGKVIE
jgi:hypothetical protein